jgi:DNA polymerase-3 subunit epsilon
MKKMFFDLETTGVDLHRSGIHQISGMIEIDGQIVKEFNHKVKPYPGAIIDPEALKIGRISEEDLKGYADIKTTYKSVIRMLARYVDRFDRKDKMWLVGFNNNAFDNQFLRRWFEYNDDTYFGSWFWSGSLDVLSLASQYLLERRQNMPNFQLKTVAKELGVVVDEGKLHDGTYDVFLTREIYRIVSGLEIEI